MDKKFGKKFFTYLVVAAVAFVCALNYQMFVFPNRFAPAGLNGICTMIQYITGVSVGYLSLLINIPLAIWVYIRVSKPLALRSMVYVVVFSVSLLILDEGVVEDLAYSTENGTSKILGPLIAGVINGYCYSLLLRCSAYSGGTDFVAALIHKHRPEQSVLGLIFTLNCLVAVSSYFVYDYEIEPVILCILYSFMSTTVSDRMIQNGRKAVRVEIVTRHPEMLSDAILHRLRHSATLVPGKGLYQGRPTNVVICIVNRTQVATIAQIVREIPDTFTVMSSVSQVMGNFKHLNTEGKYEKEFLDQGDGKAV